MPLFSLPVDVVELIFDNIIVSRRIARVMRIRLVNGQFRYFIDNSIFRLRILNEYALYGFFWPAAHSSARDSLPYLHSYLMHEVLRAQPAATSRLGRIRLAAKTLNGSDGDLECLSSLVCLAIRADVSDLLSPWHDNSEYSNRRDDGTEADVFVAAAYLGRKDYVARIISKSKQSCEDLYFDSFYSRVFGCALDAATIQGNIEIIKLLLSRLPEYRNAGTLPDSVLNGMVYDNHVSHRAETCHHEAVFDFVLDTLQTAQSKSDDQTLHASVLKGALCYASSPNSFERAVTLVPPYFRSYFPYYFPSLNEMLMRSIEMGKVEMVRYLLSKAVSPNLDLEGFTPIMQAIKAGNDTIVRMLLDYDADPTYQTRDRNNALMTAVWHGRLAMANILLDHGVDPNDGFPPPVALAVYKENMSMFQLLRDCGARLDTAETGGLVMELAHSNRLSSMQDVLVHEGVSRDIILDHKLSYNKLSKRYHSLLR
ncbi:ankyrin repeat-containing domain protein [Xylaria flabelliformis]|nr:ankyrin repeat-containing domain protein [Xylaria flabelliformis]